MDEQDRRIAELSETWMDDNGTTWTRPTAWAYAQACRVINERRDNHGLVHLEEVERLRTALRECRNQLHGLYGNHPMVQRADAALATPEVDHA
jgi:hypothetical protein